MGLSELQQQIVDARGKVVVKACPGSGKTYSVAARIADLLKTNQFHHKGIAAISFTNTAWQEINIKLREDFEVDTPLGYPHFVGTIDSFLNQYVFLPFGHLVMNCQKRPEIVGEHCHNRLYWEKQRKYGFNGFCTFIDPLEHFEKVSFDKDYHPINIGNSQDFNFSWNNIYKKDGSYVKKLQDIIDVKQEYFERGYVNQSDANYFSYKILNDYPEITKNIVQRFPFVLIDEAQDTNDIQMQIIDLFVGHGMEEIMLIGDPDQAIYEWNNANPSLFNEKHDVWSSLTLNENRRSSKNICYLANRFVGYQASAPMQNGEVIDFNYKPQLRSIQYHAEENRKKLIPSPESINQIIEQFLKSCRENHIPITKNKVAILFRSKNYRKYFGESVIEFKDQPWKTGCYHLRDIVHGKLLFDKGEFKRGFQLIEQGFYKGVNKCVHVTRELIQNEIDKIGFVPYRKKIFEFIYKLPKTDQNLYDWIEEANDIFRSVNIHIDYTRYRSRVPISRFFIKDGLINRDYYCGTIHSAKGCTFDAVLLLLNKNAGNSGNYSTLFNTAYADLDSKKQEELRIIYVGLTRPRKILDIAVPEGDYNIWSNKIKRTRQLRLFE